MRKHIFSKPLFSWGKNSLLTVNALRSTYIRALKNADSGNLEALIQFSNS